MGTPQLPEETPPLLLLLMQSTGDPGSRLSCLVLHFPQHLLLSLNHRTASLSWIPTCAPDPNTPRHLFASQHPTAPPRWLLDSAEAGCSPLPPCTLERLRCEAFLGLPTHSPELPGSHVLNIINMPFKLTVLQVNFLSQ